MRRSRDDEPIIRAPGVLIHRRGAFSPDARAKFDKLAALLAKIERNAHEPRPLRLAPHGVPFGAPMPLITMHLHEPDVHATVSLAPPGATPATSLWEATDVDRQPPPSSVPSSVPSAGRVVDSQSGEFRVAARAGVGANDLGDERFADYGDYPGDTPLLELDETEVDVTGSLLPETRSHDDEFEIEFESPRKLGLPERNALLDRLLARDEPEPASGRERIAAPPESDRVAVLAPMRPSIAPSPPHDGAPASKASDVGMTHTWIEGSSSDAPSTAPPPRGRETGRDADSGSHRTSERVLKPSLRVETPHISVHDEPVGGDPEHEPSLASVGDPLPLPPRTSTVLHPSLLPQAFRPWPLHDDGRDIAAFSARVSPAPPATFGALLDASLDL